MILGADALYCLPENDIVFGDKDMLTDNLGVLLYGNIDNILENLQYLPCMSNIPDKLTPLVSSEYLNVNSVNVSFSVTDSEGKLLLSELQRAIGHIILHSIDDVRDQKCIISLIVTVHL